MLALEVSKSRKLKKPLRKGDWFPPEVRTGYWSYGDMALQKPSDLDNTREPLGQVDTLGLSYRYAVDGLGVHQGGEGDEDRDHEDLESHGHGCRVAAGLSKSL